MKSYTEIKLDLEKDVAVLKKIHIIRRLIEGALARQLPLYITFIDLKKAFDLIYIIIMFAILRNYGIPYKIVSGDAFFLLMKTFP